MGADGGRSRKALEAVEKQGVTKVYHLNGGLMGWTEKGHPIVK